MLRSWGHGYQNKFR